jgi:hypothetical protein
MIRSMHLELVAISQVMLCSATVDLSDYFKTYVPLVLLNASHNRAACLPHVSFTPHSRGVLYTSDDLSSKWRRFVPVK